MGGEPAAAVILWSFVLYFTILVYGPRKHLWLYGRAWSLFSDPAAEFELASISDRSMWVVLLFIQYVNE